jgi:hypothetical protein
MSFRVDVEEDGVKTGDWVESLAEAFGDAVPSFESLFFLEDLLESLPRESCCGEQGQRHAEIEWGKGARLTTLAPKRFIFEDNSFSSVGD